MNIGILVSGRGSNMVNILEHIKAGDIKGEVKVVISNKASAPALIKAKEFNVDTKVILPKEYETKVDYDKEVVKTLKSYDVELVVLAGYMKLITPYFVNEFKNKIINIHPALLPSFKGLDAQKQALDYGVRYSGCTVHFVDEGMDTGKIILQRVVPVLPDDTEETLSDRILEQEHKLYPYVIKLICENKVEIIDNKIKVFEE